MTFWVNLVWSALPNVFWFMKLVSSAIPNVLMLAHHRFWDIKTFTIYLRLFII